MLHEWPDRYPPESSGSPRDLAALLLRQRRTVVGTVLLAVVAAVVVTLLTTHRYTSSASFFPQSRRTPSNLSGLAAQFGLALPVGEPGQSPQFYVSLLTSREILNALVDSSFTGSDGRPRPLWQRIEVPDGPAALRAEKAVERLRRSISASSDSKTGVVSFSVQTTDPALSQQVAAALLASVSGYNLVYRQSQAAAERRFTELRLRDVAGELRSAENRLQSFLASNRDYRNSPLLSFEADRLEREVQFRQQVYSSLAQSLEQAKIEEVRDTPVISVIDNPRRPARPDSRGGVGKVLLGLLGGACLGVLIALGRELARRLDGTVTQEPADLGEELRRTWRDVRRPWRLLPRLRTDAKGRT